MLTRSETIPRTTLQTQHHQTQITYSSTTMPGLFNYFTSAGREERRECRQDKLRTKMLRQAREDKFEAKYERNQRARYERDPAPSRGYYAPEESRRTRTLPSRTTRTIANRFDDDDLESIAGWSHNDPDELRYGNVGSRVRVTSGRQLRHAPSARAMPDIAVPGGIYWPERSYGYYDEEPRSRRYR